MKRTIWKTAAVAAVAALALTACSSGDSGETEPTASSTGPDTSPVTLNFTWWGNDDRAARYNEALALFEEVPVHHGPDQLRCVPGLLDRALHRGRRSLPPGRHAVRPVVPA